MAAVFVCERSRCVYIVVSDKKQHSEHLSLVCAPMYDSLSHSLQSPSLTCRRLPDCREGNVSLLCDCLSHCVCVNTSFENFLVSCFTSAPPLCFWAVDQRGTRLLTVAWIHSQKWMDRCCFGRGWSLYVHMYSISKRSGWLKKGKTWGDEFPITGDHSTIGFHWGWFFLPNVFTTRPGR